MAASERKAQFVYVGTSAHTEGQAEVRPDTIYVFRKGEAISAAWEPVQEVGGQVYPSYLTPHPSGRYLYVATRPEETNGEPGGAVSAFAIDPADGTLTYLNRQSSRGFGPAYVSIDHSGRCVLVANYRSGSVAMLPIAEDGRLGPPSDWVQHQGKGTREDRQEGPHAHCIIPDPGNRFALAADLGLDRVFVYRMDLENGKLVPNDPPYGQTKPAAGPRHLAFHPNRRFLYVIDELDCTVTAFAWDGERGSLEGVQSISTLPAGWEGESDTADLHFSPDGRFLYGSNRGHDSIVIYSVDAVSGQLTLVGHQPTFGNTPRNFALDESGQHLFAANQNSDNIVAFRRDEGSGLLAPLGLEVRVPAPTCVKLVSP